MCVCACTCISICRGINIIPFLYYLYRGCFFVCVCFVFLFFSYFETLYENTPKMKRLIWKISSLEILLINNLKNFFFQYFKNFILFITIIWIFSTVFSFLLFLNSLLSTSISPFMFLSYFKFLFVFHFLFSCSFYCFFILPLFLIFFYF